MEENTLTVLGADEVTPKQTEKVVLLTSKVEFFTFIDQLKADQIEDHTDLHIVITFFKDHSDTGIQMRQFREAYRVCCQKFTNLRINSLTSLDPSQATSLLVAQVSRSRLGHLTCFSWSVPLKESSYHGFFDAPHLGDLAGVIRYNPGLRSCACTGIYFPGFPDDFRYLAEAFENHKGLQELHLKSCIPFHKKRPEYLLQVLDAISTIPNLRSLGIGNFIPATFDPALPPMIDIEEDPIYKVCAIPTLQKLDVSEIMVASHTQEPSSTGATFEGLSRFFQIARIAIERSETITDLAISAYPSLLDYDNIVHLVLDSVELDSENWERLARVVRDTRVLQGMRIAVDNACRSVQIRPDGCIDGPFVPFLEALKLNSTIKALFMRGCDLMANSDNSNSAFNDKLAEMMKVNHTIVALSVDWEQKEWCFDPVFHWDVECASGELPALEFSSEKDDSIVCNHATFYMKLNVVGRKELSENLAATYLWIDALVRAQKSVSALFYLLRLNPALCNQAKLKEEDHAFLPRGKTLDLAKALTAKKDAPLTESDFFRVEPISTNPFDRRHGW